MTHLKCSKTFLACIIYSLECLIYSLGFVDAIPWLTNKNNLIVFQMVVNLKVPTTEHVEELGEGKPIRGDAM